MILYNFLFFCGAVWIPLTALILLKEGKKLRKKVEDKSNVPKVQGKPNPNVNSPVPLFKARPSLFDETFHSSEMMTSKHRGLFHLFTIASVFFVASHHVRHVVKEGTIWGFHSFIAMFQNSDVLGVWVGMIVITFLAYPLQKYTVKYSPSFRLQIVLHSLLVSSMFSWVISMIWFHPGWAIIPTGSLCLSLMVMMMKVHSYLSNNRELSASNHLKTKRSKRSKRTERVQSEYPDNVTLMNFIDFMLVPTLVYDIKYPRTSGIRVGYLMEKCILIVGIITFLHLLSHYYIIPALLRSPDESPLEVVTELTMPFLFSLMLIFYLIFDCICNGFAEITCFADREFYKETCSDNSHRSQIGGIRLQWMNLHARGISLYISGCFIMSIFNLCNRTKLVNIVHLS
eukprot:TRINITY_DN12280_c0_g1_i21.p1 TRINITY_DN12280_c0_g1~~TRINITY_DN12280_c0_g1_i21.p1  ORF type:complete len:399 (+),score=33.90 TRINITY_DN12280_c0_g1_i21:94-1290(+)